MRIIGIDTGEKRVGVAISDALGITAQGLSVIERKGDESLFDELKNIIDEHKVIEIVVGLPLNMDGSYGPKAKEAVRFSESLGKKFDIPIKLWDERMTTAEVQRIMIAADVSRQKRKKKIDKLAAQVMLQSYLNSKKYE